MLEEQQSQHVLYTSVAWVRVDTSFEQSKTRRPHVPQTPNRRLTYRSADLTGRRARITTGLRDFGPSRARLPGVTFMHVRAWTNSAIIRRFCSQFPSIRFIQ